MPITPTGFIPFTAEEEIVNMQGVLTSTFGSSANLDPGTVNGQLIQEWADIALASETAQNEIYSQQFDPRYAQGIFLETICALNGIIKKQAVSSVVTCTITGLVGTVIPILSQILNANGDIFLLDAEVTIPSGGTIDAQFSSLVAGPINCDAGTLTRIVQQVNGWSTVNNIANGVVGSAIQSDFSLRNSYNYLLGLESAGAVQALIAALADNPNIKNSAVGQNTTGTVQEIGGVLIEPHSVYISIDPGTATQNEIAAIIVAKLSAGCGMVGNTDYVYTDPIFTYQTYLVTYEVPPVFNVQFNVLIGGQASDFSTDIKQQVREAFYNNFYGYDAVIGLSRIRIGELINVGRFYPSLANLGIYTTQSLTVELQVGGSPAPSLQMDLNQLPMVALEDVGPIPPGSLGPEDIYVIVDFTIT